MHICQMFFSAQTTYLIAIISILSMIGIGMAGCSKKTSGLPSEEEQYNEAVEYAQSILGTSSKVMVNEQGTLFLCLTNISPRVQYAVTDLDKKTILSKRSTNGFVKWNSNTSLRVQDLPAVLQDKRSKPSDFIKIIELKQPL